MLFVCLVCCLRACACAIAQVGFRSPSLRELAIRFAEHMSRRGGPLDDPSLLLCCAPPCAPPRDQPCPLLGTSPRPLPRTRPCNRPSPAAPLEPEALQPLEPEALQPPAPGPTPAAKGLDGGGEGCITPRDVAAVRAALRGALGACLDDRQDDCPGDRLGRGRGDGVGGGIGDIDGAGSIWGIGGGDSIGGGIGGFGGGIGGIGGCDKGMGGERSGRVGPFAEWFGSLVTTPARADPDAYRAAAASGATRKGAVASIAATLGAEAFASLRKAVGPGWSSGARPVLRRRLGVKFAFMADEDFSGESGSGSGGDGLGVRNGDGSSGGEGTRSGGGTLFVDGTALRFGPPAWPLVNNLCARSLHRAPVPLSAVPPLEEAEAWSAVTGLVGELLLCGALFVG